MTYEAAEQKFLSTADADYFVEEYRLADFVEKTELEDFVTATDFTSALKNFMTTNAQLDAKLQDFVTAAQVNSMFANFASNIEIQSADGQFFATVTVNDKTYKFAVAEV